MTVEVRTTAVVRRPEIPFVLSLTKDATIHFLAQFILRQAQDERKHGTGGSWIAALSCALPLRYLSALLAMTMEGDKTVIARGA